MTETSRLMTENDGNDDNGGNGRPSAPLCTGFTVTRRAKLTFLDFSIRDSDRVQLTFSYRDGRSTKSDQRTEYARPR